MSARQQSALYRRRAQIARRSGQSYNEVNRNAASPISPRQQGVLNRGRAQIARATGTSFGQQVRQVSNPQQAVGILQQLRQAPAARTPGGGGGGSWGGGQMPTAAAPTPPPVSSRVKIDVTPNKKVGKPAGVKAAEADKLAALAALAAQQRREEVALRDQYSQNLMAAQSSAADIYGGAAPAIFGQAVTGAKRQFISGRSGQVQESIAERAALRRTYDEAIRQAYVAAAQQAQQDAYNRAQMALMASQTMGY